MHRGEHHLHRHNTHTQMQANTQRKAMKRNISPYSCHALLQAGWQIVKAAAMDAMWTVETLWINNM